MHIQLLIPNFFESSMKDPNPIVSIFREKDYCVKGIALCN